MQNFSLTKYSDEMSPLFTVMVWFCIESNKFPLGYVRRTRSGWNSKSIVRTQKRDFQGTKVCSFKLIKRSSNTPLKTHKLLPFRPEVPAERID